MDSSFRDALSILNAHDGVTLEFTTAWQRMIAELLVGHQQSQHRAALHTLFRETALASPGQASEASIPLLAAALQPLPRASSKAPAIQTLARWWHSRFGDELDPQWRNDLQDVRFELRQIRGLGPETVDRLLLFGAGQPVFPVDRGTLRILVRHGWLDLPVEDEDAQSLLRGATGGQVATMQALARRLRELGESHCGREPRCSECPLKSYLPPGGPLNPDAC